MWVCLCNQFNEKTVKEGILALAKDLPEKPDTEQLEQFYHDVYDWCGKNLGHKGAIPQCFSCFDEFVKLAIKEAIPSLAAQKSEQDSIHNFPIPLLSK